MTGPRPEPRTRWRPTLPGESRRCRRNDRWARCDEPVVAELLRGTRRPGNWYAYCATHLLGYNREVVDGAVWWRGTR